MAHHKGYEPGNGSRFAKDAYKKAHKALAAHGTLDGYESVPGIGSGIRKHLAALIATGKSEELRKAEAFGPPFSVGELTRIPGIGPVKALELFTKYKISSLVEMRNAIDTGVVTDINIVKGYWDMVASGERFPRAWVAKAVTPVLATIRSTKGINRAILAGSFRRRRQDGRDIDILIDVDSYDVVPDLVKTLSKKLGYEVTLGDRGGEKKAYMSMPIHGETRKLDLNFIETRSWGTAVMHATGPASFNAAVRTHIKHTHDMSLSQYALTSGKRKYYYETEEEVFEAIGIPYVEPMYRDFVTDVTVGYAGVDRMTIAGDTHYHSKDSDGDLEFGRVIANARKLGHEFVCLTDHGPARDGLSDEALRDRTKQLRYHEHMTPVYSGAEVDVRLDGTLDYEDRTLKLLDYVIVALHIQPGIRTLERLTKAFRKLEELDVPAILAHPTGRIIGRRAEIDIDYGELFKLTKLYNVVLEINCQPDRCDLSEERIHQALRNKNRFVIASDCHGTNSAELLEIGLDIAERAGLQPKQVINSSHKRFREFLRYD